MTTQTIITRCRVCGRRLTNPDSVKIEIGPVCKKRLERIQKLDEYMNQDSGEEYYEREEEPHGRYDLYPEEEKELEATLPTCPSCGKVSPNPNYCPWCGGPIKAKPLEVVA